MNIHNFGCYSELGTEVSRLSCCMAKILSCCLAVVDLKVSLVQSWRDLSLDIFGV